MKKSPDGVLFRDFLDSEADFAAIYLEYAVGLFNFMAPRDAYHKACKPYTPIYKHSIVDFQVYGLCASHMLDGPKRR